MPSTRSRPVATAAAPYTRVKAHLKDGLARGLWAPGARMPSEAELVAQFGVSRMTVGRALKELQAEGLVSRSQGVGSFAAPLHKVASTLTLHDLQEEIVARGHVHSARVDLLQAEAAPAALAQQLGLAAGAPVFHSRVLHLENGLPLQCEDRYVNPAAAPGYLAQDYTRTTPTHYLLSVAPLWEAQYAIEAGRPTADEARLLGITADEPCLVIVRRTQSRGVGGLPGLPSLPVTLVRLVHPGARYTLAGHFSP